jgi:2-(1,2-epoxy-1,2-dihydrophenyl)acetyl-CoA isomerase
MTCAMTDKNSPVLFSQDQGVARIRFNRSASLNAIDERLAQEFLAACKMINASSDARVVVLSGEGRSFMAGGDLACFHADLPRAAETATAIIEPLHEALSILADLPQPVLACLHGAVAGAGVSVALACDLAIAASDARFNLAYAAIGASPDGSSSWFLPRVVGLRKAMEIAMLAESFNAEEALRLGIVNRVVHASTLVAETEALAQRIANGPTVAYSKIKQLMRASLGRSLDEQMKAEADAFRACAGTADFAEGIGAFFEKRKPRFEGK